jgi:hypothetical protein
LGRSEDDDSDSAPFDPDKAPTDPPETLNIFENQRYISKLIQWGLEASERDQSRPHLVERDDDESEEFWPRNSAQWTGLFRLQI